MKFDMNAAWQDTVALLEGNKDLLLVIAGLFFFLPGLAFVLFGPPPPAQDIANLQGEAAMRAVMDIYTQNGPWLFVTSLVQSIGVLAMLALLRSADRPTVGEALKTGATGFLPYLGAQLMIALGAALAIGLPIALAAATGVGALVGLLALVAIPVAFYLMVKFAMVAPVMAIERTFNPIAALKRSWDLSKGNSVRIFLFFALVLVSILVVALVLGLLFQLASALTGGETLGGILSSLFGALYTTIFTTVLAATYRQLAGQGPSNVAETFD